MYSVFRQTDLMGLEGSQSTFRLLTPISRRPFTTKPRSSPCADIGRRTLSFGNGNGSIGPTMPKVCGFHVFKNYYHIDQLRAFACLLRNLAYPVAFFRFSHPPHRFSPERRRRKAGAPDHSFPYPHRLFKLWITLRPARSGGQHSRHYFFARSTAGPSRGGQSNPQICSRPCQHRSICKTGPED